MGVIIPPRLCASSSVRRSQVAGADADLRSSVCLITTRRKTTIFFRRRRKVNFVCTRWSSESCTVAYPHNEFMSHVNTHSNNSFGNPPKKDDHCNHTHRRYPPPPRDGSSHLYGCYGGSPRSALARNSRACVHAYAGGRLDKLGWGYPPIQVS